MSGSAPAAATICRARVLARHLGKFVPGNPTVVVKNSPGAGGLSMVNSFYSNAAKDGTELATFDRGIPLDPLLHGTNARFDPLKLVWIGSTDNDASTCLSWHSSPVKTIDDLMKQELIVGGTGSTANSVVFFRVRSMRCSAQNSRSYWAIPVRPKRWIGIERGEVHGFCGFGFATLKSLRPDWVRDRKVNQLVQLAVRKNADHPEVPLALDLARTDADRDGLRLVVSPNLMARPFAAPPGLPADRLEVLRTAFATATVSAPEYQAEAYPRPAFRAGGGGRNRRASAPALRHAERHRRTHAGGDQVDRGERTAHVPIPAASRFASATSAAVSGVIGSRGGTTSPMVCTASGSTIGIARMVSVRPSVSASARRHHARPAAGAHMREQHDHGIGFQRRLRVAAGRAQQAVDDAAVLHVGREQAERHLRDLRPGHALAVAERRVGRGEQLIALLIERHRVDAAERLVVEIGDAGVDLEIVEQRRGSRSRCATGSVKRTSGWRAR